MPGLVAMKRASWRARTSPSAPSALMGKVTTAGPGREAPPPQAVAGRITARIPTRQELFRVRKVPPRRIANPALQTPRYSAATRRVTPAAPLTKRAPHQRGSLAFSRQLEELGQQRVDLLEQGRNGRHVDRVLVQQVRDGAEQVPQEVARARLGRDVEMHWGKVHHQSQEIEMERPEIEREDMAYRR